MKRWNGMPPKFGHGDSYLKNASNPGILPTFHFYSGIMGILLRLWQKARKGQCDDFAWTSGSEEVAIMLEKIGCAVEIEGMSAIDNADGPCVFIANHMSTLETFVLPAIIRPRRPVTFVVKKSLVTMPVFGPIMRSRDPVVVGRSNPRDDLATVLSEGSRRLADGISVVVFPQSTRSMFFSPENFNTIGVKLARHAKVPVVPLALKTDAWGQGNKIKELGKIRPDLPVRFKFAQPMEVTGNGKKEHAQICAFIQKTLSDWQKKDGVNS